MNRDYWQRNEWDMTYKRAPVERRDGGAWSVRVDGVWLGLEYASEEDARRAYADGVEVAAHCPFSPTFCYPPTCCGGTD